MFFALLHFSHLSWKTFYSFDPAFVIPRRKSRVVWWLHVGMYVSWYVCVTTASLLVRSIIQDYQNSPSRVRPSHRYYSPHVWHRFNKNTVTSLHTYIYIMISDTLCRKCMEEIVLTFLCNNHSWIFHCIKVMTLGSRYFANRFSIVIFDHYIFLDCIYRVCTYDNLFLVRRVENVLRKFH